jgi:DNA helicase-2/ATP-dependent DNA helicase PcrA
MPALTDGLNTQQLAAVKHEGSPLLVVAGAGSGKTRVCLLYTSDAADDIL